MLYISNSFSIQMLSAEGANVSFTPVSVQETVSIICNSTYITPAIGHEDTAAIVSSILEHKVRCNRINISLTEKDILIVAQLTGGRLPEGCTTLPDGFTIKFFKVKLLPYTTKESIDKFLDSLENEKEDILKYYGETSLDRVIYHDDSLISIDLLIKFIEKRIELEPSTIVDELKIYISTIHLLKETGIPTNYMYVEKLAKEYFDKLYKY